MFSLLYSETTESLRAFLIPVLTEISSNWWSANVIPALSFQQQRMVEDKGVDSLSGLDLAALLRILDKNWYDISVRCRLDNEARTWTREMQHIRNRWAYAPPVSHAARRAILLWQPHGATNEKIRVMRNSQCESAEGDFNRRMADLDKAELQADLTARPVAFGVMVVE